MKKIKSNVAFGIGIPADAHDIIRILVDAKVRTDDPELEGRYCKAIQAIGLLWLERVEALYEPEEKKYSVKVCGDAWIEVLAKSEDEAKAIVKTGLKSYETIEDVEEVK